jgi:hypothetical protein
MKYLTLILLLATLIVMSALSYKDKDTTWKEAFRDCTAFYLIAMAISVPLSKVIQL